MGYGKYINMVNSIKLSCTSCRKLYFNKVRDPPDFKYYWIDAKFLNESQQQKKTTISFWNKIGICTKEYIIKCTYKRLNCRLIAISLVK